MIASKVTLLNGTALFPKEVCTFVENQQICPNESWDNQVNNYHGSQKSFSRWSTRFPNHQKGKGQTLRLLSIIRLSNVHQWLTPTSNNNITPTFTASITKHALCVSLMTRTQSNNGHVQGICQRNSLLRLVWQNTRLNFPNKISQHLVYA